MNGKTSVSENFYPKSENRWRSFITYKLVVCCWMLNEISMIIQPSTIAGNGWYICSVIQILSIIFIGIPLVYSEMCIAQYTKSDAVTMWDFFPLLRGVGYASYYLVFLKSVYTLVLATWYLEYSFFSTLDPPPWYYCDDFNTTKCMVKRVNVSIFQHCMEMMKLHEIDCGMKTASNWVFEREIGNNTTLLNWPGCMYPWKMMLTSALICFIIFILSIKNDKLTQSLVKVISFYIGCTCFLVLWTALTAEGTWLGTSKYYITLEIYHFNNTCVYCSNAVLGLGVGCGIILHFTKETAFRSPANMNSIFTSLVSLFITLLYAGIAFSSFKSMTYYHGEENIIEEGECEFFQIFPVLTESLSYYGGQRIWTFFWFSSILLSLFLNEWIVFLYLRENLLECKHLKKFGKSLSFCLLIVLYCVSSIFFCNDLAAALADALKVIQAISCLLFSVSLYWCYGFRTHSVDILFMIGVKSSLFWKIAWVVNPIALTIFLYALCSDLYIYHYKISATIDALSISYDVLTYNVLLGIYLFIIFAGLVAEILKYKHMNEISNILYPTDDWGPWDIVLFKSRKMFVPEIMTREFLYRQVRIHGYGKPEKQTIEKTESISSESMFEKQEWNVYTSN